MPRLFVGIEVTEEVGFRLSLLRGGLLDARWIEPSDYHATLRFVGDIDNKNADLVAVELSKIDRKMFDLRVTGLDCFGGDKPRSVFARIEPSEQLSALQFEIEVLCQRVGLEAESRKFVPHVTLARLRQTSSFEVANYLSLNGGFPSFEFTAQRFALYSAKDSTGGGPYLVEQVYNLSS